MLKTMFAYVNGQNQICHVLIDENNEDIFLFNTSTLKGFKPHFIDGIEGIFEYVDEDISYISYIHEVNNDYIEDIFEYLQSENAMLENYQKFYNMFMEFYKEKKEEV